MESPKQRHFLIFTVHTQRFALPVEEIERVAAAAALMPLPDAPSFLRGVIDWGGTMVPVMDLRVRLGLPHLPLDPEQRLLLVRSREIFLAFLVDTVEGVTLLDVETLQFPPEARALFPENFSSPLVGKKGEADPVVCLRNAEALFSVLPEAMPYLQELGLSQEASTP